MIEQYVNYLRARLNIADREEGATLVEYGMLVALIAAISVGVVTTLGTDIQAAFQKIVDKI